MLIPAVLSAAAVLAAIVLVRGWRSEKIIAAGDLMSGLQTMPDEWSMGCPGAASFYHSDRPTRFRNRPTDAETKALLGAPPLPVLSDLFPCPGSCVNVLTHVWHSWYLTRNQLTRRWTLHVLTYAQYRCMATGDPAAQRPHVLGHPKDPSRPPMA
jgi:hypothetical protein